MKKAFLLSLLSLQAALLIGCSRNPNSVMPNQAVSAPGAALPTTGTGAGYSDPYGAGAGYGTGTGTGYSDPYGAGAGTGYGTTPGYTDPYGAGAGYGTAPAYGTGAGYGTGTAYGTNPCMDPGISQQVITKIQAAGGYKALKADNVVIDYLKTLSMPIQQAFQAAPLTNRVLIIKTLLDGWAGSDEVNYARQIWNTIMPQDQQTLTGQDPELAKLVQKLNGGSSSGGTSSILSSIGKVFGLSK